MRHEVSSESDGDWASPPSPHSEAPPLPSDAFQATIIRHRIAPPLPAGRPTRLRRDIWYAADLARHHDPRLAAKCHRLAVERGLHHYSALCHVAMVVGGGASRGGSNAESGAGRTLVGAGDPNDHVRGNVGDIYQRLDKDPTNSEPTLYVKEAGDEPMNRLSDIRRYVRTGNTPACMQAFPNAQDRRYGRSNRDVVRLSSAWASRSG